MASEPRVQTEMSWKVHQTSALARAKTRFARAVYLHMVPQTRTRLHYTCENMIIAMRMLIDRKFLDVLLIVHFISSQWPGIGLANLACSRSQMTMFMQCFQQERIDSSGQWPWRSGCPAAFFTDPQHFFSCSSSATQSSRSSRCRGRRRAPARATRVHWWPANPQEPTNPLNSQHSDVAAFYY